MPKSGNDVMIAQSEEERDEIRHFRYQTYVVEQGKRPRSADHRRERLTDEFDENAILLYARRDEHIVGTVRLNHWPGGDVPPHWRKWYGLDRFEYYGPESWIFCTFFMVAPEFRGTTLTSRIIRAAYKVFCELGGRFVFAQVAPNLVPLYSHIGMKRYTESFVNDEVGFRVPMVMVVEDPDYLTAVRSPCASLSRKMRHSDETARWFAAEFPDRLGLMHEQLDPDRFIAAFRRRFALNDRGLFAGLTAEQTEEVARGGTVLECSEGDRILRHGDTGDELFIVLSGTAERRTASDSTSAELLGPGEVFGELSFLDAKHRLDEIRARSPMMVLMVSPQVLTRIAQRSTDTALKLITHVAKRLSGRVRSQGETAYAPARCDIRRAAAMEADLETLERELEVAI